MLESDMWNIFKATGNINAYLYMTNCKDCDDKKASNIPFNQVDTEASGLENTLENNSEDKGMF